MALPPLPLLAVDQAREALNDMPPRSEEELDPVTLHNQALMNMEADPTTGFSKLNYLLANVSRISFSLPPSCPGLR